MKPTDKFSLSAFDFLCAISVALVCAFSAFAQQDDQPKSRDIVPVFDSARPQAAAGKVSNGNANAGKSTRPVYTRIAQKTNSGKVGRIDRPGKNRPARPAAQKPFADIQTAEAKQIGVTLWKLSVDGGGGGRDLSVETLGQTIGGKTRYLIPQRVSLDTIFDVGDYVRLGIESGNHGYLYVIDQEMYADGTTGDAYLIFPNKRLRGGANTVAAGSPVEIPDLANNPFYFELRPQPGGKKIIAEILSVIVADQPIAGLEIGGSPLLVSEQMLNNWRTKWAGRAEIFEAQSNFKKGYTKAERQAASGGQKLTVADSLPQTIFLVADNHRGGTLITVPLWYGADE